MRRTELLQEVRKMRFEEAYTGWQEGRLRQEEAARRLGVGERTFRRYIERYEEEGLEGLIDRRLSQVSHRRAPVDEVMALCERHERSALPWERPPGPGASMTAVAARSTAAALARVQQVWLRREKMFATANVLSRASPLPRMPFE